MNNIVRDQTVIAIIENNVVIKCTYTNTIDSLPMYSRRAKKYILNDVFFARIGQIMFVYWHTTLEYKMYGEFVSTTWFHSKLEVTLGDSDDCLIYLSVFQ